MIRDWLSGLDLRSVSLELLSADRSSACTPAVLFLPLSTQDKSMVFR